jgi:hypothetical protein
METGIMERGSRFDWEGITIAAFLTGYVALGGVVFAKVAAFGAYFIN